MSTSNENIIYPALRSYRDSEQRYTDADYADQEEHDQNELYDRWDDFGAIYNETIPDEGRRFRRLVRGIGKGVKELRKYAKDPLVAGAAGFAVGGAGGAQTAAQASQLLSTIDTPSQKEKPADLLSALSQNDPELMRALNILLEKLDENKKHGKKSMNQSVPGSKKTKDTTDYENLTQVLKLLSRSNKINAKGLELEEVAVRSSRCSNKIYAPILPWSNYFPFKKGSDLQASINLFGFTHTIGRALVIEHTPKRLKVRLNVDAMPLFGISQTKILIAIEYKHEGSGNRVALKANNLTFTESKLNIKSGKNVRRILLPFKIFGHDISEIIFSKKNNKEAELTLLSSSGDYVFSLKGL